MKHFLLILIVLVNAGAFNLFGKSFKEYQAEIEHAVNEKRWNDVAPIYKQMRKEFRNNIHEVVMFESDMDKILTFYQGYYQFKEVSESGSEFEIKKLYQNQIQTKIHALPKSITASHQFVEKLNKDKNWIIDVYNKIIKEEESISNAWSDAGINDRDRKKWEDMGLDLEMAKRWTAIGLEYNQVWSWHTNGFKDPKIAKNWIDAGFSADKAKEWIALPPSEAKNWSALTLYPKKAKVLYDQGATVSDVKGWIDSDYGFANNGFREDFTFEEIKEWKKAGFGPRKAMLYKNTELSIERAIQDRNILKNKCGGKIKNFEELLTSNPYDTKNQCFEFAGSLFQLLDRSTGLYENDKMFYVDFGTKSAEGVSFGGYVISLGAFKYTATNGSVNIIPKLKPIVEFKK